MAKRSNMVLDDDILLFQILPRQPARSLGRFKCVCKQWHSFLTTPVFTKMHLHYVNNQNHHKQLLVPSGKPCRYFQTIDCQTPEVGLSANRSIPFQANEMSIISSLNGLVCVGINSLQVGENKYYPDIVGENKYYSDIILWNPLTGDYKTLSKDNSDGNCFSVAATYWLYYSCRDDDYKLLRITLSSDAYIYSLKSDSWRKVESTINCFLQRWTLGCFLNEKVYFIGRGRSQTRAWSYLIIRFDIGTEKFNEIPLPFSKYATSCFGLMVVNGCIRLCVSSRTANRQDKWEVWKMDEDRVWTKVVCYYDKICRFVLSKPLRLMENGNWLVGFVAKDYVRVQEIDLEMKREEKVDLCIATTDAMKILRGGKFVETIVSLKQ